MLVLCRVNSRCLSRCSKSGCGGEIQRALAAGSANLCVMIDTWICGSKVRGGRIHDSTGLIGQDKDSAAAALCGAAVLAFIGLLLVTTYNVHLLPLLLPPLQNHGSAQRTHRYTR